MCAIIQLLWVRKLTGKPALPTIADCESEARRIQCAQAAIFFADSINVSRIQSDLLPGYLAIAFSICRFSSGESLALTMIRRNLAFAIFGLPIFDFINSLCKTKIIVD